MEDDGVEGDDVEIAGEAEEVVVLGLGVDAAELVAGCQKRQCGENYTSVAGGQVSFAPEQDHGGEDVGHVVNYVVQERPVEEGERLADPETAGEETVGRVDEERGEHQPQRLYGLALEGGHEHKEREHGSARRVQVHGHGLRPEPGGCLRVVHVSSFLYLMVLDLRHAQYLMIPATTVCLLHLGDGPQRTYAVYGGGDFLGARQAHLTRVATVATLGVE